MPVVNHGRLLGPFISNSTQERFEDARGGTLCHMQIMEGYLDFSYLFQRRKDLKIPGVAHCASSKSWKVTWTFHI